MPKVLNYKNDKIPADAIFIGRPSKYGNPFKIGIDGTRKEVIQKYKDWIIDQDIESIKHELRGKDLVCCCSPLKCHGDILIIIVNDIEDIL